MATYTLTDMVSDANGALHYTEDVASMGIIEKSKYLHIPPNLKVPKGFEPVTSEGYEEDFLFLNWSKLVEGKLTESDAAFCATLRLRMVKEGMIASETTERSIYVDEYLYYGDEDKEKKIEKYEKSAMMISGFTREMVQFVNTFFHAIVGTVSHIFRVRGHHWKDDYAESYDKAWKSTAIDIPSNMRMPAWSVIAKDGLHCFGVRVLQLLTKRGIEKSELPTGLLVRIHAACVGTAPVLTCAAALVEMKSAKWWSVFEKRFERQLVELSREAERLRNADVEAHINAKLYDFRTKRIMPNEESISGLIPYILGWIDTLDRREAITGQKSLSKRGQGGAEIRTAFSALILAENRNDRTKESVASYLLAT
jgi:hypothetical protein